MAKQLELSKLKQIGEALQDASDHLDYCGYGDSWERECAKESNLEAKITAALEVFNDFIKENTQCNQSE